jgi:hypothetical protein
MVCSGCKERVPDGIAICAHCGLENLPPKLATSAEPITPEPLSLPPFFAVPVWKLALMSFFTLGLYDLYWFYRNWQRIRVREQKNISPAIRVFFAFLFCIPCLLKIRKYGLTIGVRPVPPMILLALLWLIARLMGDMPQPLILPSLCGVLFLLPVQAYVNRVNAVAVPAHDRNNRLTRANIFWILIGAIVLLLNLMRSIWAPLSQPPVP